MISMEQAQELMGRDLYTESGEKVGRIGQVFLDNETGQPEWVTVNTSLFGSNESFVPLTDARMSEQGLTVPFDKDRIKNAPNVDAESGQLSPREEAELYQHYGLEYTESGRLDTSGVAAAAGSPVGRVGRGPGPAEEAMTRSEERLRTGTEQIATGRARLRKYVVSENVTTTVPVSREEVRVEREPITDANVDRAMAEPDLSEQEHEVTLHEERPVVEKETVPVERVRLDTETVTGQEPVSADVRKEEVELVNETGRDSGRPSGRRNRNA